MLESMPGGGTVYLTFDDGPHPDHTPRLLEVSVTIKLRLLFSFWAIDVSIIAKSWIA